MKMEMSEAKRGLEKVLSALRSEDEEEDAEDVPSASAMGLIEESVPQPPTQSESPTTSPVAVSSRKRKNPEDSFIETEMEVWSLTQFIFC